MLKGIALEIRMRNYVRVCLANKFIGIHILLHVITNTQAACEL